MKSILPHFFVATFLLSCSNTAPDFPGDNAQKTDIITSYGISLNGIPEFDSVTVHISVDSVARERLLFNPLDMNGDSNILFDFVADEGSDISLFSLVWNHGEVVGYQDRKTSSSEISAINFLAGDAPPAPKTNPIFLPTPQALIVNTSPMNPDFLYFHVTFDSIPDIDITEIHHFSNLCTYTVGVDMGRDGFVDNSWPLNRNTTQWSLAEGLTKPTSQTKFNVVITPNCRGYGDLPPKTMPLSPQIDANAFIDSRDGQPYPTVTIGTQTWMATNLNYASPTSKCFRDSTAYCDTDGRLYDWTSSTTICPADWHLPTDAEWGELLSATNSSATDATPLMADLGYFKGSDTYGFAGVPTGAFLGGDFSISKYEAWWWSSNSQYTFHLLSDNTSQRIAVTDDFWLNVRCIKD